MRTIWKFTLEIANTQTIAMPQGAQILDVQWQGGFPCMWAIVDTETAAGVRKFEIYGTGTPMDSQAGLSAGLYYVATFQQSPFVWHLFERMEENGDNEIALDLNRTEAKRRRE
jgi:hypothetical protein